MSLITCDDDCVYQKDGYCMLETPSVINNNNLNKHCVHYIKLTSNKDMQQETTHDKLSSQLFI